ncbi:MAG: type 1 pili tip component [Candidatus Competibacteraceae bacterium]|nr:type 1 pili tip component [Candidatus Competibacteraceae bacterium]
MKVTEMLEKWEKDSSSPLTAREYPVRLTVHDAARVAALAEMYPHKSEEAIITELLSAALDAVEAGLPYVKGERVIAEDELGDPIYEDAGPTPRFLKLSREHTARLTGQREQERS